MHRAARLPKIDSRESGRRPSDRPKMPLGFLKKVEQCVSIVIGRGQGRGEPALERGKRGLQVIPMVDRACWRAQAAQAFGGFTNSFASAFYRRVVDDRTRTSDRTLQQEA